MHSIFRQMYSPYYAENEIYIIFMHQIIIRWSVLVCRLGRNQISFVGVYFVQVFEKTNCQNKMNQWSLSWYSRGFLSGWHWHQKRSGACILLFSPPKQHAKVGVPFPPSLKLIYYQLVLCSYLYEVVVSILWIVTKVQVFSQWKINNFREELSALCQVKILYWSFTIFLFEKKKIRKLK